MAFWAVVQEPAEFDAWLARQQAPVPPPRTAEQARGMQVFGEAGCGACHAVRGTAWQGRLGPDLSRIGSRLSLGAGLHEVHRATLAGWIAGTQDIKPGNPCRPMAAPCRARICWRWPPGWRRCADGHQPATRGDRPAQSLPRPEAELAALEAVWRARAAGAASPRSTTTSSARSSSVRRCSSSCSPACSPWSSVPSSPGRA
ncbi:hypothetical protein ACFQU2_16195 [Siccirubricoccus deserti]